MSHFVCFFIVFWEVQFWIYCFLQTFLVVQQRNHQFVTLSLEEMATRSMICIQESKYSGESGADFLCMCVCVRACVVLTLSVYTSMSYCTAVERGISVFLNAGYCNNVRNTFNVPDCTNWEMYTFRTLIFLIDLAIDKMYHIQNTLHIFTKPQLLRTSFSG